MAAARTPARFLIRLDREGYLLSLLPGVLLILAAGSAGTAQAQAQAQPTLCVVHQDPVAGLEPEALRVAVALEKRRLAATFNRLDAPSLDDCPAGNRTVVIVVGAGDAWWQGADGAPKAMETRTMDPRDRASEVARRIVSSLVEPAVMSAPSIVEGALTRPTPAPRQFGGLDAAQPKTAEPPVEGYVRAGGRYEYQSGLRLHAGSLDLEAGVSLVGERLAIGLRGGWQPELEVRGTGMTARVTSVPFSLLVRGGMKWARARVRLGLGAGLEWRRVEMRPEFSSRRPVDTRIEPTLEAELEVAVPFARRFRVLVAGAVRAFPAWTNYTWAGRAILAGPKVGLGAALRLEALFGEGGR